MMMSRIFYLFKPYLPRSAQLSLRRLRINLKKKWACAVWPIDPEAGRAPEGWTGWPEKKDFALVLVHDVDTKKGHENCLQLAEIEKNLGFRSSFNFVPERYDVSCDLRNYLIQNGFEVGVHGLCHDGKLFWSRKIFRSRAIRINHYLKEWGAVGFYSPSMHRNFEWMHELNIEYDHSSFDTDPFEPQPDGVGTIFPFVVYRNSGQPLRTADRRRQTADRRRPQTPEPGTQNQGTGSSASQLPILPASQQRSYYVELPYTLPQDHLLFVLMKERDGNIWKRKLDWIADRGGMASLNTHPDFMNFGDQRRCREEYAIEHYKEFLRYVRDKYAGKYWHALPRQVARFWSSQEMHKQQSKG